jgi:hypothetical protein
MNCGEPRPRVIKTTPTLRTYECRLPRCAFRFLVPVRSPEATT